MTWKTWAALVLSAVFMVALARDVHAQDKAAAEALFDEGRKLMDAKNYAAACDKFERSQQIDPSVGTLLNLGACFEKLNKLASAWTRYREAGNLAAKTGDPRANVAAEHARSLEPKVSKLTINVTDAAKVDGLEVTRDGTKLTSALYGAPTPVDAGSHVITATAPGKKAFKQEIKIAESETKAVTIPGFDSETAAAGTTPPTTEPQTGTPEGGEQTADVSTDKAVKKSNQKTLAYVALAVGVVGIGVGSYLGLSAKSKYNDAKAECASGTENCSADSVQKGKDAKSQANIATVAWGVGIVGLAAGTILWFTAPKEGSSPTAYRPRKRVAVIPIVSPTANGVLVQGYLP